MRSGSHPFWLRVRWSSERMEFGKSSTESEV
jgi:hypothetical protein